MIYPPNDRHVSAALRAGAGSSTTASITVPRTWRQPPDEQTYRVTYRNLGSTHEPVLSASIDGACYHLDDPIRLQPVNIPKPWGRECWYTGMEARGESMVLGEGGRLGIGSYLGLAPDRLCRRQPLVLLKALEPLPVPVKGELYLEVHETKQEVYVVTGIDPVAWPDGQGRMRYGVNQALRARYADDDAFREAFLAAVENYESIRRSVDAGDSRLEGEEDRARQAALAFTAERSLRVGNVVSVPTWVPHSLQHGVRVVEFQTPTYERFIITSSQRVLTQDRWDSAHAISRMRLDSPPDPAPAPVAPGVHRIVRFDDFGVWQAELHAGASVSLPGTLPYALALCISGEVCLPGTGRELRLTDDQAALIPAMAVDRAISATATSRLLLAAPGL